MSLHKHERFIRGKLKDQEVDLDKDALWAAVSQQPKRDNKKFFFILLFLGVASVGLVFINQYYSSAIANSNANAKAKASASASASASANSNSNSNSKQEITTKNIKVDDIKSNTTINDQEDLNTTVSQTVNAKTEDSIGENNIPTFDIEAGETTSFSNSNNLKSINHEVDEFSVTNTNSSISKKHINNNPLTKNSNTQLLNNYKTQHSNERENTLTNISIERKSQELIEIPLLHSLSLLNQLPVASDLEFDGSSMIQPIKNSKLNVQLDFEFGTGIIFQKLSTNNSELESYLNSIKAFEKPLDYYHGQLGIKLIHNTLPFYLKTGLSYSRISSRIQLNSTTYTDTIINGTQYYDVDITGARNAIEGDVMAVKVTDYRAKWHTYHHMVDIPIVLGYNLIKTPTIGLSVEAGISANILNHSQGAYINEDGFLNKFSNRDDNIYNKNLGLNFQAGLDFRFLLTRKNSFSLRANWTQLGQMTNRQSEIIKKYQVLGINLGIQHRL